MRPLLVAFAFLTRLPLGGPMLEPARLGQAVALFPVVGLALGGLLVAVNWLLGSHFDVELSAFALLTVWVLGTGALHLDGVADVADALAGGRGDRGRTLAIMKDSRIGAIGATLLIVCLLGKWIALAAVLRAELVWPLIVAPVGARWLAACALGLFPSARSSGLGFTLGSATRAPHLAVASISALAIVSYFGFSAAIPLVFGLSLGLGLCLHLRRRIGGMSGDVLGAAIELVELGCLIACRWR